MRAVSIVGGAGAVIMKVIRPASNFHIEWKYWKIIMRKIIKDTKFRRNAETAIEAFSSNAYIIKLPETELKQ